MTVFQSPHTEGLSATVAAWEAEVPVSTAAEAEAGSVSTGGLTLSSFAQHPGEGVALVSSWSSRSTVLTSRGGWAPRGGTSHWPSSSVCKVHSEALWGQA